MLFSLLKLSAANLPMNCVVNTILVPRSGYVECTQLRSIVTTMSISGTSLVNNASSLFSVVNSSTVSDLCRVLHGTVGTRDISHDVDSHLREVGANLLKEISAAEDTIADENPCLVKSSDFKNGKELERRRKIGLANKGKVPWNKGRKHSAGAFHCDLFLRRKFELPEFSKLSSFTTFTETCERIRQKTREALSNPKIRKKMSECPRSLSDRTKTKIAISLKKVWGKRLKWKRARQKVLQLWAESIAIAAKEGGIDQEELEWDSFEKMKSELALIEQEQAEQKAKEKELARIRAEITAKERLTQKKKKHEQKTKLGGQSKRKMRKKSKEEKEELAVNQELKLKARLVKIHRRKSVISQVSRQHQRAWDNMELTTREDVLPQITLADQICLARTRRAGYTT